MSAKKTGLGRGFDSLIPTELLDESFDPTAGQDETISDLRSIKLSEISPDPDQPRRQFDVGGIDELTQSIALHGVLQPIVVTPAKTGYQIVAGERRYRAATQAGLDKIPALVRTLSGQHRLELSLIENLQRQDLNVMETATAYLKLRDQFNLTLEDIGTRVGGKSPSSVSNTLRLLKLPEGVRQALAGGQISEGQARPLIGQRDDIIQEVLPRIISEGWSARKIEQYIVQLKGMPQSHGRAVEATPYRTETARLQKRFKTDVAVKTNTRGAGQIVIRFKNADEFARIEKLLDS